MIARYTMVLGEPDGCAMTLICRWGDSGMWEYNNDINKYNIYIYNMIIIYILYIVWDVSEATCTTLPTFCIKRVMKHSGVCGKYASLSLGRSIFGLECVFAVPEQIACVYVVSYIRYNSSWYVNINIYYIYIIYIMHKYIIARMSFIIRNQSLST